MMAREEHYRSLLGEPEVMPRRFDGLLGWSARWRCMVDPQEKPVPLDDIDSLDPSAAEVTVREGETLSQIARQHGCSVQELAQLNSIRNVSLIWPGQVLKLPLREYRYSSVEHIEAISPAGQSCSLSFAFEDLLENPLKQLKVNIVSAAGDIYQSVTDELGRIEDYIMAKAQEITVLVSGAHGVKEVARFTPSEGESSVRLTSPKVRVSGVTQPVKDRAGTLDIDRHPVNTLVSGRDSRGNPLLQINHTCPNKYHLQLGKNLDYWDQIILASERSGIIPQSIAAVINAESAQDKNGVWQKNSTAINRAKTRVARELKKQQGEPADDIVIYSSSAAGMTQFLNGTWLDETFREGTYLNQQARKRGILADKEKRNMLMQIEYHPKTHQPIILPMFEIAADSWWTKQQIIDNGLIKGRTPYPRHATSALQAWLNLRFEPEFIIMAAVDYGLYNLAKLQAAGFNVNALNDAEKAKIFYLTHHLGLGDARRFINKTITEEHAQKLLVAQIGERRAAIYAEDNFNYIEGHRGWLSKYIDNRIKISDFYCPGYLNVKVSGSGELESIIEKLGR